MTNATRKALVALYPTLHKTARELAAARLSLEILHLNWETMMETYSKFANPAKQKAEIKKFLLDYFQKDIFLLIISNCCVQALDIEMYQNAGNSITHNDDNPSKYGKTVSEITAGIVDDLLPEVIVRLDAIRSRY